ncbi:response regulator transcription factor [Sandarakinorhabdus rubra]|uniref:response regulator transcription factor n=1 Tax=Sandarakinorhabdus rubra TaxID=2672568 RepID=UPI0013DC7FF4|nr:helix-turn-helix transcriptional regulator [Sandarakinorhabdus rubra]
MLEKNGFGDGCALDFSRAATNRYSVVKQSSHEGQRDQRVMLLTDAERDCLRLVYQHMTSKDIARQLGVSPHTVDMRLRQAIRKLEVTSRIEAARALMAEELATGIVGDFARPAADIAADGYQPLIYQAPEIAGEADLAKMGSPASEGAGAASIRSSDPKQLEHGSLARTLHQNQNKLVADPAGGSLAQPVASAGNVASAATLATDWPGIAAPDPGVDARPFLNTRPWGRRNDLPVGHRLGWMMFIAFGSALTFGSVLAALAALKTLI